MLWSIILRLVEIAVEWGQCIGTAPSFGLQPWLREATPGRSPHRPAQSCRHHSPSALCSVPPQSGEGQTQGQSPRQGASQRNGQSDSQRQRLDPGRHSHSRPHPPVPPSQRQQHINVHVSIISADSTNAPQHIIPQNSSASLSIAREKGREGKERERKERKGNGSAVMRGVRKRSEWGRHKTCSIVLVLACGLGPYREDCAIRRLLLGKLRQAIEHALPDRAIGSRYVLV
jgi:hypothetical protein